MDKNCRNNDISHLDILSWKEKARVFTECQPLQKKYLRCPYRLSRRHRRCLSVHKVPTNRLHKPCESLEDLAEFHFQACVAVQFCPFWNDIGWEQNLDEWWMDDEYLWIMTWLAPMKLPGSEGFAFHSHLLAKLRVQNQKWTGNPLQPPFPWNFKDAVQSILFQIRTILFALTTSHIFSLRRTLQLYLQLLSVKSNMNQGESKATSQVEQVPVSWCILGMLATTTRLMYFGNASSVSRFSCLSSFRLELDPSGWCTKYAQNPHTVTAAEMFLQVSRVQHFDPWIE